MATKKSGNDSQYDIGSDSTKKRDKPPVVMNANKKKSPSEADSDSLYAYESRRNQRLAKGDTAGANRDAKEFNRISDRYSLRGFQAESTKAVNDLKAARARKASGKSVGEGESAHKPILPTKKKP